MKKFIAAVFILFHITAFAGRGATLIIDNATKEYITVKSVNSNCVIGQERINTTIGAVNVANIYLEASNDILKGCSYSSSKGEIELYTPKGDFIARTSYSISNTGTNAWVSSQGGDFVTNSYAHNTYDRGSDKDLIVINVTPSDKNIQEYANWMGNMKEQLQDKSLSRLVLPGTHDSLTNDLSTSLCEADPDSAWYKTFGMGFAKAQYLDMSQQLNRGIRYFDIRLCHQGGTNYISHTLLSKKSFETSLEQLSLFLNQHPVEVVILDLQHIYGYDKNTLAALLDFIQVKFAGKIISHEKFNPDSKLADIWNSNSGANLIVILPDNDLAQELMTNPKYSFAWPRSTINSPWADTRSAEDLVNKNSQYLENRAFDSFFVNQLQLTPDGDFITKNLSYSLERMAYESLDKVYQWQWNNLQSGKMNILMRDWSDGYDGTILAMQANKVNR